MGQGNRCHESPPCQDQSSFPAPIGPNCADQFSSKQRDFGLRNGGSRTGRIPSFVDWNRNLSRHQATMREKNRTFLKSEFALKLGPESDIRKAGRGPVDSFLSVCRSVPIRSRARVSTWRFSSPPERGPTTRNKIWPLFGAAYPSPFASSTGRRRSQMPDFAKLIAMATARTRRLPAM